METRTPVTKEWLSQRGFLENRFSFDKDDFVLMKTTLGIWYEVVYKHKIIRKITAITEEVEAIYLELTKEKLSVKQQ